MQVQMCIAWLISLHYMGVILDLFVALPFNSVFALLNRDDPQILTHFSNCPSPPLAQLFPHTSLFADLSAWNIGERFDNIRLG
jgi:hypothetical protein